MRTVLLAAMCVVSFPAFALSCGDVITRDVVLDRDLDCRQSTTALTVGRSGVTLDLNGFSILGGAGTTAVALEDISAVRVRGPGRIQGAATGIEATRTSRVSVSNIDFEDVGDGVRLHNSSRALVADNRFAGVGGHAIVALALPYALTRGGMHELRGNQVSRSEFGVLLSGHDSGQTLIATNQFTDIGTFAITLDADALPTAVVNNDFGDVGVASIVY